MGGQGVRVGAEFSRPRQRSPQRRTSLGRAPGGLKIGVEIGLLLVVNRQGVMLAAFLAKPQPPALALLVTAGSTIGLQCRRPPVPILSGAL